jgi:glycosyltransferase involved in cell wall biosynthesis
MDNPDIIIPTLKSQYDIAPMVCYVAGFSFGCRVLATCRKDSAAVNRNAGLNMSKSEVVIMIDDDIGGLQLDWWKVLVEPFARRPEYVGMVSARLCKRDGSNGPMMFMGDISKQECEVPAVPTACCAIRMTPGLRFNEQFRGSGWEDTFFCQEVAHQAVTNKILIVNTLCVVHLNEQKNQGNIYFSHNKATYDRLIAERGWGNFA